MTTQKKRPFPVQPEEHIKEEAMAIAKATQFPAQSKQQTRLIAQGIAKGIAEYKRREKAKARALDKQRKKQSKQSAEVTASNQADSTRKETDSSRKTTRLPMAASALALALGGAVQAAWFFTGTPLAIGDEPIPSYWLLAVAAIALVLAIWLLAALRR